MSWLKTSSIYRWTRVLNKSTFNSQAEGRGSLRQAIMYDYNNKSNGKQVKRNCSNMKSGVGFGSSQQKKGYELLKQ